MSHSGEEFHTSRERQRSHDPEEENRPPVDAAVELRALAVECGHAGWDGYGALPVSSLTIELAEKVLRLVDPDLPQPDVSAHPDGAVAFEWYQQPNRTFLLSVQPDGLLVWMDVCDGIRVKGTHPPVRSCPLWFSQGFARRLIAKPKAPRSWTVPHDPQPIMNVYIYPTDRDWYQHLSQQHPLPDEVNFWRPGGKQRFSALASGDLLLFRFGAPDHAIVGGGTYTHFSFAPLYQVWDAFGQKNGTRDYRSLLDLIARYRKFEGPPEQAANSVIGCIVLTAPFFLPRDRWFKVPPEYEVNSPQGQRYAASSPVGSRLLAQVTEALRAEAGRRTYEGEAPAMQFGESIVRRRLGQGHSRSWLPTPMNGAAR
ncbi:MAG: hypothetical protein IPK85_06230 [Gemmatimonadetes bacterium]|nr:hypothetical protein [Gemmatimonadota bacterium]